MKNAKRYIGYDDKVMATKEIFDYLNNLKNRHSLNIPKIKIAKPIECEEKELPIDPYVFGCWLGDANSAVTYYTSDVLNTIYTTSAITTIY